MTHAEKIAALKSMIADGRFHHATYRNHGTLWEGLYIYEKRPNEAGRFEYHPALMFSPRDEGGKQHEEEAYALVRHTGVSVGAFGQG